MRRCAPVERHVDNLGRGMRFVSRHTFLFLSLRCCPLLTFTNEVFRLMLVSSGPLSCPCSTQPLVVSADREGIRDRPENSLLFDSPLNGSPLHGNFRRLAFKAKVSPIRWSFFRYIYLFQLFSSLVKPQRALHQPYTIYIHPGDEPATQALLRSTAVDGDDDDDDDEANGLAAMCLTANSIAAS